MASGYAKLPDEAPLSGSRAENARSAFKQRDPEKSKAAHMLAQHKEENSEEGKYLKPIVFGGLDGISTIFAFLAGAVGAELEIKNVIALGFAQLLAGAIGMGMGEYLSSQAEREVAQREEQREHWEVENNPEGEVQEMVQIYCGKGLSQDDALIVARTLSKYQDFWVEHMMLHEIGMLPAEGSSALAIQKGCVMFFAFFVLGALPLMAYIAISFAFADTSSRTEAACATGFTASASLFLLGMVKAYISDTSLMFSGASMMIQGLLSASGAYIVGSLLPTYFQLDVA